MVLPPVQKPDRRRPGQVPCIVRHAHVVVDELDRFVLGIHQNGCLRILVVERKRTRLRVHVFGADDLSFKYAEAVFAAAANVDIGAVPVGDHVIETIKFNEEYPAGMEIGEPLPEGFKTEEFLWVVEEVALEDLTFFGCKKTSSSPEEWTVRLLHYPDSWYCSQEDLLYHALEQYRRKLSSD